jgi:hypothetical protein
MSDPSRERQGGGTSVEAGGARYVLFPVHEHVNDSMSDLTRRFESARMISIAPDAPSPPIRAVHRPCEANGRSHQPSGERHFVVGFDEQVDVIGLHGEVDDPKPRARRTGHSAPDRVENDLLA